MIEITDFKGNTWKEHLKVPRRIIVNKEQKAKKIKKNEL